jgi:hypothetical protein
VVLDTSHSMDWETSEGVTKWDAVREALGAFFVDPGSAGLSVALTYFPRGSEDQVAEPCSADVPCSENLAVCMPVRLCFPGLAASCFEDSDCEVPGETCHELGICEAQGIICAADDPSACGGSEPCALQSTCWGGKTCEPSLYAEPNVPLGILPDNAAALLASLSSQVTGNGTPTLPALGTVVEAAKQRAIDEPTHAVLVLLATDGFPNTCDPAVYEGDLAGAIESLANVTASGAAGGARTFVVGVVTPDEKELAQENLDLVAGAGGTEHAWLVTADQSLTDQFLETLQTLQYEVATCQQVLPDVPEGSPHRDLGGVRVRSIGPAGDVLLGRVSGKDECAEGGFYFTAKGGPVRVVLCPSSCNAAEGGQVEVTFPCEWEPPGTL